MPRHHFNCATCGKPAWGYYHPSNGNKKPRCCSIPCGNVYKARHSDNDNFMQKRWKRPAIRWTQEMEDLIRETYALHYPSRHRPQPSSAALDILSKHHLLNHIPRRIIAVRARRLGLIEPRERLWSKLEIELLTEMAGTWPVKTIWRKFRERDFNRSKTAIIVKMKRLGYSQRVDLYSGRDVATALGMDDKTCIKQIFEKGLVKYHRDGKRGPNNGYFIEPKHLASFIREYPHIVNRYKPDIPFMVALLDEFKASRVQWTERDIEAMAGA